MGPQQKWITTENLLLAVKRVCDDVIRTNNEHLPTMFADRQEFEDLRKSTEQKFLSDDTFNAYKRSLEIRLKSIEEKLTHRYVLLTINRHDKNGNSESKSYFNLDSIIRAFKNGNLHWLKSIITCLSIALLALYLISSITNWTEQSTPRHSNPKKKDKTMASGLWVSFLTQKHPTSL